MKANELMIGDWVFYTTPKTPTPVKIGKIYVNKEASMSEVNFYGNLGNDCISEICFEPIPLTADLLKKNGFDQNGLSEDLVPVEERDYSDDTYVWSEPFTEYFNVMVSVYIEEGREFVEIDYLYGHMDIKCKYVHELQHALRLCGIEKEIEL